MMDHEIRHEIGKMVSGEIRFEEPLCRYTSMGVGGPADALVFPQNPEETGLLVSFLAGHNIPFLPAGNWTNLIVRDGGYRGVVIGLRNLRTVRVLSGDAPGRTDVYAEGGAGLADLVSLSVEAGLSGMEFCAGIPGSVGGAVKMNAGAYGREMKDVIHTVSIMDRSGRIREYETAHLAFRYRCLDIPAGHLILAADYRLSGGDRGTIKEKVQEIMAKRRGKHPLEYRNAGSIFKNPAGRPAGQIIEEAGLKGLRVGGAMISEKHGNFIVNIGAAKAKDITALMDMIQERVHAWDGTVLEPEVVIIGEET